MANKKRNGLLKSFLVKEVKNDVITGKTAKGKKHRNAG